MKHFAKLLKNNQGVSIVEILLALAITTIVLGIAYGLFFTGMKTYEKIAVEQALRDEADYVVSRIMQKVYETDISDIKDCSTATTPCIEIYSTESMKIQTGDSNHQVGIASLHEYKGTEGEIIQIKIDENNNVVFEYYESKEDVYEAGNKLRTERINSEHINFIVNVESEESEIDEDSEIRSDFNALCSYATSIIYNQSNKLINKKCANGIVDLTLVIEKENNNDLQLQLNSKFGF